MDENNNNSDFCNVYRGLELSLILSASLLLLFRASSSVFFDIFYDKVFTDGLQML